MPACVSMRGACLLCVCEEKTRLLASSLSMRGKVLFLDAYFYAKEKVSAKMYFWGTDLNAICIYLSVICVCVFVCVCTRAHAKEIVS